MGYKSAIAWLCIVIIGVWGGIGNNMILFLGGLQDIPKDYYEAAAIDGSTGVHSFFHITIPLLSPMLFLRDPDRDHRRSPAL